MYNALETTLFRSTMAVGSPPKAGIIIQGTPSRFLPRPLVSYKVYMPKAKNEERCIFDAPRRAPHASCHVLSAECSHCCLLPVSIHPPPAPALVV